MKRKIIPNSSENRSRTRQIENEHKGKREVEEQGTRAEEKVTARLAGERSQREQGEKIRSWSFAHQSLRRSRGRECVRVAGGGAFKVVAARKIGE